MNSSIRIHTTVLPGHRIEINAPDLPVGQNVDVTVVPAAAPSMARLSMLDFLQSLPPGPLLYPTSKEADQYLKEERDS